MALHQVSGTLVQFHVRQEIFNSKSFALCSESCKSKTNTRTKVSRHFITWNLLVCLFVIGPTKYRCGNNPVIILPTNSKLMEKTSYTESGHDLTYIRYSPYDLTGLIWRSDMYLVTMSSQIVIGVWWFFILIIVSSYTGTSLIRELIRIRNELPQMTTDVDTRLEYDTHVM